jgi:hypothetical protein
MMKDNDFMIDLSKTILSQFYPDEKEVKSSELVSMLKVMDNLLFQKIKERALTMD